MLPTREGEEKAYLDENRHDYVKNSYSVQWIIKIFLHLCFW